MMENGKDLIQHKETQPGRNEKMSGNFTVCWNERTEQQRQDVETQELVDENLGNEMLEIETTDFGGICTIAAAASILIR